MEMINKNEAKLEISMIFVQPSSRLMYFLMGWLLVLGLKDCLVKCATVCVRSMVILRDVFTWGNQYDSLLDLLIGVQV